MAVLIDPGIGGRDDDALLAEAASQGFALVRCESEHGQLVWEWRRGDEPRPQFVTRRVAIHWMREFLGRSPRVA